MFTYKYPKPSVAVDCVIFGFDGNALNVLLIKRKQAPFKGQWAIPGGFVEENESCEIAAYRELQEETGLRNTNMELVGVFSDPKRDPRERVISITYYTLIKKDDSIKGADDAEEAQWFPLKEIPPLAFDHASLLTSARKCLITKATFRPIGLNILSECFSLTDLHLLYEAVLGKRIAIRTLQRKLTSIKLLMTANTPDSTRRKRAKMLCFDADKYNELTQKGIFIAFK